MFVVLRKATTYWFEENSNKFSIYEMRMDGLGEKKLFRENLEGPRILMYYDRDSKTLFVSDQNPGYILSHSNEGLHASIYILNLVSHMDLKIY